MNIEILENRFIALEKFYGRYPAASLWHQMQRACDCLGAMKNPKSFPQDVLIEIEKEVEGILVNLETKAEKIREGRSAEYKDVCPSHSGIDKNL